MFKSEFAKECSKSKNDLLDIISDNDNSSKVGDLDWVSHDKFREILDRQELNIRKSASTLDLQCPLPLPMPRISSPHPRRLSSSAAASRSRLHSGSAVTSLPLPTNTDKEELLRLEEENSKLRQQLEMFSASNIVDSKYAKLASEVVRLQSSVSQMEQTKMFYENSTRQLVNILECLSSQLRTSHHHCAMEAAEAPPDSGDSFDSLLSRPSASSDLSNYRTCPDLDNFPVYENVFHDNQPRSEATPTPGAMVSSAGAGVTSPDSFLFKLPEAEASMARLQQREESLGSGPAVSAQQTEVIRATPLARPEIGARNRILMGSSSAVRRAMSNRSNPDNVRSVTALARLEAGAAAEAREDQAISSSTIKYSRSRSVASGLPRMGDNSLSLHDGSYESKSLLRKKKEGFSKLLRNMKSFVAKDKKRIKSNEYEASSSKKPSFSVPKFSHQSQTCLTPRSLKQVQHHSTPRLVKH